MLNGGIQSLFGSVFGSFYLSGTLVQSTYTYDEGGSIIASDDTTQPVKVQQDAVTEAMRATGGYSQNDKRFIILQSGVTGRLDGDCKLIFEGVTYMLRSPEQDPARSYWAVRAVPETGDT